MAKKVARTFPSNPHVCELSESKDLVLCIFVSPSNRHSAPCGANKRQGRKGRKMGRMEGGPAGHSLAGTWQGGTEAWRRVETEPRNCVRALF